MVKPRETLSEIEICEHGGGGSRRRDGSGGGRDGGSRRRDKSRKIIDFSVNLNPYGPPDFVFDAVREAAAEISEYPDSDCCELRARISGREGCREEEILVGAGASELIRLVALSFVKKRAVLPRHTYGEYEVAARLVGVEGGAGVKIERVEMPGLRGKPEQVVEKMKKGDVVFLCNPNNPTGQYLSEDEVRQVLEEAERVDALLVLDEAYRDFVEKAFSQRPTPTQTGNLVVLRSLTKSFAVPGLRLGYAISSAENIKMMRKAQAPWSVSVFAQRVGQAVVGSAGEEFLNQTRRKIERSKKRIEEAFAGSIQTDANFYAFDVGNASAREVKRRLLRCGILVRDCASFGLPSHIRFSVRRDEENEVLLHFLLEKEFSEKREVLSPLHRNAHHIAVSEQVRETNTLSPELH